MLCRQACFEAMDPGSTCPTLFMAVLQKLGQEPTPHLCLLPFRHAGGCWRPSIGGLPDQTQLPDSSACGRPQPVFRGQQGCSRPCSAPVPGWRRLQDGDRVQQHHRRGQFRCGSLAEWRSLQEIGLRVGALLDGTVCREATECNSTTGEVSFGVEALLNGAVCKRSIRAWEPCWMAQSAEMQQGATVPLTRLYSYSVRLCSSAIKVFTETCCSRVEVKRLRVEQHGQEGVALRSAWPTGCFSISHWLTSRGQEVPAADRARLSHIIAPHRQQCWLVCQASTGSICTGWLSAVPFSALRAESLFHALQYCFMERHTQPGSIQQPHHTFNLFFETPLELIEQGYAVVGTGGTAGGHLLNCTERAASVCK